MLPRKKLKITVPEEQVVARAHGPTICYLTIDHCTKFQWGAVLDRKLPADVGEFLSGVSNEAGNAERWHCDNGEEFGKHSK